MDVLVSVVGGPLTKSRAGNKIALNDPNTETIQSLSVPSSI